MKTHNKNDFGDKAEDFVDEVEDLGEDSFQLITTQVNGIINKINLLPIKFPEHYLSKIHLSDIPHIKSFGIMFE